MKTVLIAIISCLVFITTQAQVDERTTHKMFCSALDNFSTAPNYVVINVKNKKTGETKELCVEAPFLQGAMMREKSNWRIDCKNYKTRYFEFSQDSALWNISFDLYAKTELEVFAKSININEVVQSVKEGRLTTKTFYGDRKEQQMFAHIMFNHGIMMTRGCIAGNICGLEYFKIEQRQSK